MTTPPPPQRRLRRRRPHYANGPAVAVLGLALSAAAATPHGDEVVDPFFRVHGSSRAAPAFADLDGDGDLDLALGMYEGFAYYENVGTAQWPVYRKAEEADSVLRNVTAYDPYPADGSNVTIAKRRKNVAPCFGDLDLDGDLDGVTGGSGGLVYFWENTGTPEAPEFLTSVAIAGVDVGGRSVPWLADLDGDGLLDLVVGRLDGTLSFYGNTGEVDAAATLALGGDARETVIRYKRSTGSVQGRTSAVTPEFASAWPGRKWSLAGVDVEEGSSPTLGDLDGDGDLDLLLGNAYGDVAWYDNVGTAQWPVFQKRPALVVEGGENKGPAAAPRLVDLDGDGYLDLAVGEMWGSVAWHRNLKDGTFAKAPVTTADGAYDVAADLAKGAGPPYEAQATWGHNM